MEALQLGMDDKKARRLLFAPCGHPAPLLTWLLRGLLLRLR